MGKTGPPYSYKAGTPSGGILTHGGYSTIEEAVAAVEDYIDKNPCGIGTFYISIRDQGGNDVAALGYEKKLVTNEDTGKKETATTETYSSGPSKEDRGGGAAGATTGDTQNKLNAIVVGGTPIDWQTWAAIATVASVIIMVIVLVMTRKAAG